MAYKLVRGVSPFAFDLVCDAFAVFRYFRAGAACTNRATQPGSYIITLMVSGEFNMSFSSTMWLLHAKLPGRAQLWLEAREMGDGLPAIDGEMGSHGSLMANTHLSEFQKAFKSSG